MPVGSDNSFLERSFWQEGNERMNGMEGMGQTEESRNSPGWKKHKQRTYKGGNGFICLREGSLAELHHDLI